jgi:hypothetical protein
MAHSLRQAHRLPETPPLPGTLTNCVLKLSSSYRNPMVKHEPELHNTSCTHSAHKTDVSG